MQIKIPFKTPSVNHLYFTHRGRRILTAEARKLKKEIYTMVDFQKTLNRDTLNNKNLKVNILIFEDWYCKNGSVKKKDVANREKFLIDAVFEALGIDDRFIFIERIEKIQSASEKAIIDIEVL